MILFDIKWTCLKNIVVIQLDTCSLALFEIKIPCLRIIMLLHYAHLVKQVVWYEALMYINMALNYLERHALGLIVWYLLFHKNQPTDSVSLRLCSYGELLCDWAMRDSWSIWLSIQYFPSLLMPLCMPWLTCPHKYVIISYPQSMLFGFNLRKVVVGLDNALSPNQRQAII